MDIADFIQGFADRERQQAETAEALKGAQNESKGCLQMQKIDMARKIDAVIKNVRETWAGYEAKLQPAGFVTNSKYVDSLESGTSLHIGAEILVSKQSSSQCFEGTLSATGGLETGRISFIATSFGEFNHYPDKSFSDVTVEYVEEVFTDFLKWLTAS